ncbi:MAG: hypothetical protein IJI97_05835 [Clostridia bacterium]|jgi:hypothetical protein|nr:hypothetical protein [Clostridia bacterium]
MDEMTAGEFVSGLWSGGGTNMIADNGHTNDGEYPFTHTEDNAFRSCPGCVREGWA